MSKQKGLIKLEGTIGGIVFYQSVGQHLARIANGPSAERIATDASFVRTRENNAEFGGSATAGKALRLAFATSATTTADTYFPGRLTAIFRKICSKNTTGIRGQRSILLSTNGIALQGMNFNDHISFSSIFSAPFSVTTIAARTSATLTVGAFLPASFIQAPVGATHFKLVHSLGVVSDYLYNSATEEYEPADSVNNTLSAVTYSDATPLVGTTTATFSLVTALPGTPTLTSDVSVIETLGIEFYQRVGTVDYLFAQGNASKVINVF